MLIAQSMEDAVGCEAGGGDAARSPTRVDFGEETRDLAPAGSFAGLARFADQDDEEIEAVAGGAHAAVRCVADEVAEGGQELEENGGGIGFGVRGKAADDETGKTVEGGFAEYGMLGRGGRLWLRCGESRAGLLLGLDAEQLVPATLYVGDSGQDRPGYPRACVAYHISTLVRFLMFVEKSLVTWD